MASQAKSAAIDGIYKRLREFGDAFTPEVIGENLKLFAAIQEREPFADVEVIRDLRYGEDERHRLNVFQANGAAKEARPVLVFMHGGGFIGGDKSMPGMPFYDNVGVWGARHGLVGVNITHRLAPKHPWPAGSQDVAAALQWIRKNIGTHGGDPQQVFLMGQSAGGAHVAQFLAHARFDSADRSALAGAILVSGLYDTNTMDKNQLFKAYFGEDASLYAERSALPGVAESPVPLMVTLAEFDPPDFKRQYVELLRAYLEKKHGLPALAWLPGHSHLSGILAVNTERNFLGDRVLEFIESRGA
ncbi:MAG TPA: alpha/beta hydrolase [Candidatus Acidoferrales bacterium]|jgi:triacylglycerol lipase|nr:alpha/beta hydrolase [Candidatus Acidoferrales bacterium]